jgi:hypothetical protein
LVLFGIAGGVGDDGGFERTDWIGIDEDERRTSMSEKCLWQVERLYENLM